MIDSVIIEIFGNASDDINKKETIDVMIGGKQFHADIIKNYRWLVDSHSPFHLNDLQKISLRLDNDYISCRHDDTLNVPNKVCHVRFQVCRKWSFIVESGFSDAHISIFNRRDCCSSALSYSSLSEEEIAPCNLSSCSSPEITQDELDVKVSVWGNNYYSFLLRYAELENKKIITHNEAEIRNRLAINENRITKVFRDLLAAIVKQNNITFELEK